jgi:hypothetical protein
MVFILPLFYFLVTLASITVLANKPIKLLLPLFFYGVALILYGFALINQLKFGFWFILLAPLIIFAFTILRKNLFTNPDCQPTTTVTQVRCNLVQIKTQLQSKFLTPTLPIFIFLYIIIVCLNYNRTFTNWDDFSHWGPMIKEMVRLDYLYDVPKSLSVMHQDYPPILQIFEFFLCKLTGSFNEAACFIAVQTFTLAPLISAIDIKPTRFRLIKLLLSLTTIIILPTITREALFYQTTLQDFPQAIIGGFACYQLLRSTFALNAYTHSSLNFLKWLNFILTLCVIILIKPTGFFFYGLCVLIAICVFVHKFRLSSLTKLRPKIFLFSIVTLILPLLTYLSWQIRVAHYGNGGQGTWRLTEILNILTRNVAPWQNETSSNYLKAIFNLMVTKFTLPIPFAGTIELPVSYFGMFALCVLLTLMLSYFFLNKTQVIELLLTVILATVAWGTFMWISYQSQFSEGEAIRLASFDRYMPPIFTAILTIFALFLIDHFTAQQSSIRRTVLLPKLKFSGLSPFFAIIFITLIVTPDANLQDLIPVSSNYGYPFLVKAKHTIQNDTPRGSNIFIFTQFNPESDTQPHRLMVGLDYQIFQHNNTNIRDRSRATGHHRVWNKPQKINFRTITSNDHISSEKLWELFKETTADYIYFLDYSEDFYHDYADVFKSLQPYSLYKIMPNQTFELIATDQN